MPGIHTFATGEVLSAANVNTYLMSQAVIQCTSGTRPGTPGSGTTIYQTDNNLYLVYDGTAWVTTTPVTAVVATAETTGSASFTNLATVGPSVSVQTNTSALVVVGAAVYNSGGSGDYSVMGYAISGATTLAASQVTAAQQNAGGSVILSVSATSLQAGLTAGINTFTAKYEIITGGTGGFSSRFITVVGIP